jgi:hypothetical protein
MSLHPSTEGVKDEEMAEMLEKIAKHLREKSRPLPPGFARYVEDHFWELLWNGEVS